MAVRAHAVPSYSYGHTAPRRTPYYRREDPVVLPRSRGFGLDFRLIGAAFAASVLVSVATYAAYYTAPAPLAQTPTEPLAKEWSEDATLGSAAALRALNGPALAARELTSQDRHADEQVFVEDSTPAAASPAARGTSSSPDLEPDRLPPDSIQAPPRIEPKSIEPQSIEPKSIEPLDMTPPYPNPTTTPPDGVAPPDSAPATPTPALDPDNPYR